VSFNNDQMDYQSYKIPISCCSISSHSCKCNTYCSLDRRNASRSLTKVLWLFESCRKGWLCRSTSQRRRFIFRQATGRLCWGVSCNNLVNLAWFRMLLGCFNIWLLFWSSEAFYLEWLLKPELSNSGYSSTIALPCSGISKDWYCSAICSLVRHVVE
jgi:hypothetical protein